MAANGICFDLYYQPKPSKVGQNGSAAAADARLAVVYLSTYLCFTYELTIFFYYLYDM